ncbi:hypothetical protein ACROYT_G021546 [Oculina patagonica]
MADVSLSESQYVRFADGRVSGSPRVNLKRASSGGNAVEPLDVFKDETALELSPLGKKQKGLNERMLKMLSQGKGASIFELVKENARETDTVDKEMLTAKDNEGFSLLHHAARCDQAGTVNFLLDNGADIDLQGNNGFTALHLAVRHKSTEAVKVLLQRGADPSIPDNETETPLLFAARRGYTEIAALLLNDTRTDVNYANSVKLTPFLVACCCGDRALCEMLLKQGADLTAKSSNLMTGLHFAAFSGSLEICELLVSSALKQCPSLKNFLDEKDVEDTTALHISCRKGCATVAELLLRHGADYEAVTGVKFTAPLHLTAMYGQEEITRLLISSGAAVESRNERLQTPLHKAAAFNHVAIAQILLDNGADQEAKDMMDLTPFLLSVVFGAKDAAEMLLDQGADIMATDSTCNSCLHLAVKCSQIEMVRLLLARGKGKFLELRNNELQTVMHLAATHEDTEILNILLEDSFLVNQRDINERLPLHIAAENGSLECVASLLRCKTLLTFANDRDKEGMSPLHLAASNKHVETCRLLMNKGSDVTSLNNRQRPPLHLAVQAGSLETVRLLLGPMLPSTLEVKDAEGNTPLHVACMYNRLEILRFFLDQGADVTARNNENMTCLDVAIDWGSVDVAKTLVKHKRWQEVVCLNSTDQVTPMEKLIQKLPEVAEIVLDQSISYCPLPTTHPDFTVTFNFHPLDPPDAITSCHRFFGPACMATYRRENLLNHSVTQMLLRWKWLVLGKFLNGFNLLFFFVFLVLFSVFIVEERGRVNLSNDDVNTTSTKVEDEYKELPAVIFTFLIIALLKEIFQMFWLGLNYFKDYTNYVDLATYACTLIYILPYVTEDDLYGDVQVHWSAGALGLMLCYVNWLLSLRRLGSVALYVTMYIEVLITFVKVIAIFACVLIGYGLVFYVLLKEEDNFSSPWFSFVKIFVMMLGEMDYSDMLTDNVVNNNKVPGTNILYVPLPELSYIMFVMFVLSVSIVLMNLLVGLAVGDIDSIQKTATLRTLMDQAFLVDNMQKKTPEWFQRLFYKTSLEFKPNQNTFIKKFAFAGIGVSDDEFLDLIRKKDSHQSTNEEDLDNYDQQRLERQEERIKTLQATVDAQGELLRAIADKLEVNN